MDWVIVAATVVIAVSSIISLVVTWRLSQDSRALRTAGTEPRLVAYLGPGRSPQRLNLVLENVGQGPARDVAYFVEADSQDFAKHNVKGLASASLRTIAKVMPQGGRREIEIGLAPLLYSSTEAKLRPFSVRICYSDLHGNRLGPEEYQLDVAELGEAQFSVPTDERLVRALTRIERRLARTGRGSGAWGQ